MDQLALYADLSVAYASIPDTTERFALLFPGAAHDSFNDACILGRMTSDLDRDLGNDSRSRGLPP